MEDITAEKTNANVVKEMAKMERERQASIRKEKAKFKYKETPNNVILPRGA